MEVPTGGFAAITGRVGELEATVAGLGRRLELATTAAGILRAAGMDAAVVAVRPQARHTRRRHLSLVPPTGGGEK